MSSSGASPGRGDDQIHGGHELEAGVLQRVREWTDVFPWVRLGRVVRIAGSPPLLIVVALALAVWASSLTWFDSDDPGRSAAQVREANTAADEPLSAGRWIVPSWWSELGLGQSGLAWPARVWRLVWSLLIWTPVALWLMRQGALLCAGRGMTGFVDGVTHAVRRTPAAWLASVLPMAGILLVGLPIFAVGWLERAVGGFAGFETPVAVLIALIAIPCGVIGFGALVAVPLSWAAIINEPAADPLESLSRGYEYLFRRPLQLVMYVCVCLAIGIVLWLFLQGVAQGASWIAEGLLAMDNPLSTDHHSGGGVAEQVAWLLQFLPTIASIALSWGLVGGIYLLLRHDAGGQEVEDLWQPAPRPQRPLPSLEPGLKKSDASTSDTRSKNE